MPDFYSEEELQMLPLHLKGLKDVWIGRLCVLGLFQDCYGKDWLYTYIYYIYIVALEHEEFFTGHECAKRRIQAY